MTGQLWLTQLKNQRSRRPYGVFATHTTGEPGKVRVSARAQGLNEAAVEIEAKP